MTETLGGHVAATIVDVAREAGVSKTTASDALRGHGRVSDATRQAVLVAARNLGYSINRSARSLRTQTTGAIGLYIPQVLVRSEHYMSFVYGVVNEAAGSDYDVTVIVAGEEARPNYAPHVDGLVLIDPVEDDPMVERLTSTGLPVVSSERFPSGRQPAGVVWSDHGRYARELLDHLAARGARRPALIGSTTVSDWSMRIQGAYRAWCRLAGVEPVIAVAPFGADASLIQREAGAMLAGETGVDALIGAGDGVAAAVAPTLTAAGHVIGEDFLLASCVDSSALQVLNPAVTAIDTKGGEAGVACARMLFELLRGDADRGTSLELPLELLIRESTRGR
ncbi:LacI family DNA-binding transcriptional regulator [Agromyces silvae]|uniref:LacI family DNA-binding transcriptional regulator n=1 Tax=Agromyces silvae TaxID=3388266 RepID=UPI00280B5279|nr:LacI family DNA-binding transcriptional regulator [Agromyces protaetiae]